MTTLGRRGGGEGRPHKRDRTLGWSETLGDSRPVDPETFDLWTGGGHPDIVERVLTLGLDLTPGALVHGNRGLTIVHPGSGTILTAIHGMAYALRLDPTSLDEARAADYASSKRWSDGGRSDLAASHGPDWVWGRWGEEEPRWLRATFAWLDAR